MSLGALWDRFWWSLMLAIFVGLLWLKIVDPVFHSSRVGAAAAFIVGAAYFTVGLRRMLAQKRREQEIEKKAREEIAAEIGKEAMR